MTIHRCNDYHKKITLVVPSKIGRPKRERAEPKFVPLVKKIEWGVLILQLRNAGVSSAELARLCGSTPETIMFYVRTNGQPRYSIGEAILQIHKYYVTDGKKNA